MKGMKGVNHIGMGVRNLPAMKQFFGTTLGMTETRLEFPEVWNPMVDVFRTSLHKFAGTMLYPPAGGIVVELVEMSLPRPRPIRKIKRYGDIGVNKITLAVSDVGKFYGDYQGRITFLSEPRSTQLPGWGGGKGEYTFVYGRDPEGNLLEFVSDPAAQMREAFSGVRWLGVAVTELERSVAFYQSVGFDTIVVKPHEAFSGLVDEAAGAKETTVRSCLLANSRGGGMLEVYESMKPRGRSMPFNTMWGDFGYFEVCIETDDFHGTAQETREKGMDHLHAPAIAFDMEDRQFWFEYVQDPDGIVVEIIGVVEK